jgi:hypothetical protein
VAYHKTELGQEVLKNRALPLSPKQRAILIMADGTKDGAQLLALTAGMGSMVEDLTDLVVKGLIVNVAGGSPQQVAVRPVAASVPVPTAAPVVPVAPQPYQEVDIQSAAPRQADYKTAYQAGVALTSSLGFKGFRLNRSMESASDVGAIRGLRPKILEAMISKHGESKARDLMRDFDRALGLR